jgi:hypothetical protein
MTGRWMPWSEDLVKGGPRRFPPLQAGPLSRHQALIVERAHESSHILDAL